jgi:replicative DNA helicase
LRDIEPAWDEGAERATLGAMIFSSREIGEALQEVKAQDFYKPSHETVFTRIVEMYLRGEKVDAVTLSSSLLASGDLQRIGGAAFIHSLAGGFVGSAGAYGQQVAAMARLRRFQGVALRIRQMGQETVLDDLEKVLDQAYHELDSVRGTQRASGVTLSDALVQVLEEVADPTEAVAMRSGLRYLDEFYRGVREGRLDVVGGRPAHGKSLMGAAFIRENTIKAKFPTVLFTMEMSAAEVTRRLIAGYAEVNLNKLTDPLKCPMDERDRQAIANAYDALEQAPLTIVEEQVGLAEIASITRDLFRGSPGFVVIDFHQLMSWPGWARREDEAVGYNAYGLKRLARSQNLHVLALAQLNRNSTSRAGGVPRLEDFGGSDKIGHAADCAILLDRPETRDETDRPGEVDIIVAKQRDGRTGITTAAFRGHRACFSDMARDRT